MADIIIPELQAFVEAHENLSSDLRIATITSVWNHNREFIKKTFEGKCLSARIPDGAVRFIDHTETIVDVVRSGAVDVGIITYPPKSKQLGKSLAVQNWKTEEMVVVMSAKSSEITGQNWAKLGLFETYAAVLLEKQYGIRREIDRYFNRRGKSINVVAELGTISEIKELIAGSGDLITILPLPTVEGDGRLRWSSLSDNIPPRPVSFVYRLGSREIVQQFLKCFSEER
jgi:DNA-binding transcriptional LysR family regulator